MSNDIDAQAVQWFVRLRAANATDADRQTHAEWLAADVEHELAYERIEQLWDEVGELEFWARTELRHLNVIPRARVWRRAGVWGVGFATAASLAFVALWWGWSPPAGEVVHIVTDKAEQRRMALDDGSRLHVNTASDLEVRYTRAIREIVVHSGESVFDVVHRGDRPFVVRAGRHSVIAMGTRFAVRRGQDGDWAVTVIDGRVAVVPGAPSAPEEFVSLLSLAPSDTYEHGVILTADQRLRIDPSGAIVGEERTNAEDATAWQAGMLKFRQTPLREVAREISRYTLGEVRVAEGVPDYPVTGIVHIRNRETMVGYLVEVVPVTPVNSDAGVTVLRAKPGAGQ